MILRAFTQNIGWKLGSVTVAFLLWVAILGEPELVTTHIAPILYRNLPQDLLIGVDALDTMRVELRGPARKLTPEHLSESAVVLDLSDVKGPGERTFTLSDADFHLPQGVIFLRAVPSQLRLHFARLATKEVPVQIRWTGQLPAGYRIAKQEAAPATLRIAGPEARVLAIQSAETDGIDLSGVTGTTEVRVNTFIADPQVRLETSPMVTVRVTIEKEKNY